MIRKPRLSSVVIQDFALIRLVQNSVGPTRHSHLFARIVDIAIVVVLKGGLEVNFAFF